MELKELIKIVDTDNAQVFLQLEIIERLDRLVELGEQAARHQPHGFASPFTDHLQETEDTRCLSCGRRKEHKLHTTY
jgi:hypothetical protein